MRAALLIALLLPLPGAAGCNRKDNVSTPDAHAGSPILANAVGAPVEPTEKTTGVASAPPRFVGRWVAEPHGGMRSAWPGTYVVGRFKGTRVSARIRDDGFNLFQVVIDGEPKRVLRTDKGKGDTLYALAEGLSDGVHDVELHKRAEAKVGEAVFYGFEAATADGRVAPMLAPADPPTRRIETLGDSITAGYGNEGPGAACGYTNSEQNEYATYGAIAARNVGADHVTTAWSGKTIHEMTEYFDKSLPARPDSPIWDFAQYQPDAIVINLGTNNFANIDPGEKRFVTLYVDLVHKVRAAYPRAFVVCALGSMLSDVYPEKRHSLTQARKYMKTAVMKLKAEGDTNLELLEFPEQNHADGLGCGFHPSLKTHKLMADWLTAFLKEHLGVVKRIALAVLGLVACSKHPPSSAGAVDAAVPAPVATVAALVDAGEPPPPVPVPTTGVLQDPARYIQAHLPKDGTYTAGDPPKLTHEVQPGETAATIAAAYLELTEIYTAAELATALIKKNGSFGAGNTIEIPSPLVHKIGEPKDERLGWPEDDPALKGVFVTGTYANIKWAEIVNQVADHGLNAIVLDSKDYDGYVNYPSKAKIAIESGAIRATNIPDLARAIRYAHWHGVRIISRVPCFHDPWTDKHLPGARLSIKYTPTNKPIHVDWLDPTSTEAQDYAIDLATESLEAGADEVQLDYVRFPVHLTHKVAVLPPKEERSKIIKAFVKRVHDVTSSAHARLSLDFFGVTATGIQEDIDMLGQDIPTVAPEADAISLMSYPSHYGKGYLGFANPADHAEIIGIGNKAAVEKLKPTHAKTVFRTWLQAFPLGVTHYGSAYLLAQAKSAETSGGTGWLMWSPSCDYAQVWNGWPSKKAAQL